MNRLMRDCSKSWMKAIVKTVEKWDDKVCDRNEDEKREIREYRHKQNGYRYDKYHDKD